MKLATLLAVPLLATLLHAQSPSAVKTVPPSAVTTEGNSSSYFPFIYDAGKFQHLINGNAFVNATGVIQEIAYRRDGASRTNFFGRTIQSFKMSIGYSKNSSTSMSTTFANNWSGTPTVIVNGTYNLPNNPPVNGLGPWNLTWKLTRPFIYTAASGNLLLEFVVGTGQAQRKQEYFVDSHANGVPGSYQVFGTAGPFKSGDRHSLFSNSTNLKPGGSADIRVTGLKSAYPAIAIYGFSNSQYGPIRLPLDLRAVGAPGNTLYVSIDLALAMPLTLSGSSYQGNFQLPIPSLPALGGITLYGTAAFVDPASNALKLVFSRGVAMNTASSGAGPSQILGASDANATRGGFLSRAGTNGPVVRLTGAFN